MANLTSLDQLGGDWTIDPTHSRLGFTVRHAMVTKVRGSFDEFSGTISVPEGEPTKGSVEVTVKTDSIDTRNADRDGHLKADDFFATEKFPEITFRSTSVTAKGADTLEVTGDLTIKETTKSVTIPVEFGGAVTDPFGALRAGFEGNLEISRSDFGVTWNAALEAGGVMVSDGVKLDIEISAVKN